MQDIMIRKASYEDAAEIANVHINSWREAYSGLLPSDFLNDLPLTFKKRQQVWQRTTINHTQVTLVAESTQHGVIGFINGGQARESNYSDSCEIYCLYLLRHYHGQKIGFNLLKKYFTIQRVLGFTSAYLWVLDQNPSIQFYKKTGGCYQQVYKEESLVGIHVKELMFFWHSLYL